MVDGSVGDSGDKHRLPELRAGLDGLAADHVSRYARWRDQGYLGAAMTFNEPPVWNGELYRQCLVEYTVRFLEHAHRQGLTCCVLNTSVSWPLAWIDAEDWWPQFKPIIEAMRPGDYVGLHEYWPSTGPDTLDSWPWRAGKHRLCPYNVPILISECGMDQNTVAQNLPWVRAGWRNYLSPQAYVEQLRRYHGMLDERVKGTCIFLLDYENNEWESHDIRYCLNELLNAQWTAYEPFPRTLAVPSGAAVILSNGAKQYAAPIVPGQTVTSPASGRVFRYENSVLHINAGWGRVTIGPIEPSVAMQADVQVGQPIGKAKGTTVVINAREYSLSGSSLTSVQVPTQQPAQQPAQQTKEPLDDIRNAVINRIGREAVIAYNPAAALIKRARELGLGAPLTNEVDVNGYRAQGFALGILYCPIGKWSEIRRLSY
jgi:hypothetical protein